MNALLIDRQLYAALLISIMAVDDQQQVNEKEFVDLQSRCRVSRMCLLII